MSAILNQLALLFSGKITAMDLTQEERVEALAVMKKKHTDLMSADERPPRELHIYEAVKCRTLQ